MNQGRFRLSTWALGATVLIGGVALIGAACGGTSSADKTATAAKSGTTPAVTAAATKAATTPAAGATTAATTAASGTVGGVKVGDTKLGKVLTDDKGMTLYVFKNDTTPGKSACNGGCATNWPPATASAAPTVAGATGAFTLITRDDGSKQVAYKGAPLYRFASDKAAGDTNGEGVAGIWSVAKP